MDKNQILNAIKYLASQKVISKEEVLTAFEEGAIGLRKDSALTHKLNLAEVLYFIGGLIVVIGISVLVYQNWTTLNFFSRLLASLGSAIAAYIVGFIFSKYEKLDLVGEAFYLISALVMPIGLSVLFDQMGLKIHESGVQTIISAILFAVFVGSYFIFRKIIFLIFGIAFATWLFFSFTNFLLGSSPLIREFKLTEYRFLLIGLSYVLLGYFFSNKVEKALTGPLYGFGVLGFLGAAMALGGWKPNQNIFWELLFPGLVFGVIFLSVHLRSKSFLLFGTIYLMGYILKITAEYFSQGLGWPLALVIAGLLLIVIGYVSFNIHRRYLIQSV